MLSSLPRTLWLLFGIYSVASLVHFTHNAQYIAFYPNMPSWIARETVYQAWLAVASVGLAGVVLLSRGWAVAGAVVVAAYGALGLDGLAHYTLALCSEHTLAANLTIGFEVVTGFALMMSAAVIATRLTVQSLRARALL